MLPDTSTQRQRRRGIALALRTALVVALALSVLGIPPASRVVAADAPPVSSTQAAATPTRYEHRVVVATTSLDRELDVEASLERRINELGAIGYELTALVGGDAAVLDLLLKRRAYVPGLVDHAGLTFAVMARPIGPAAIAREYRLLHTRTGLGVDTIVAPLGAAGYRMTVQAYDGDVTHVAFERTDARPAVEFRVFRNRGRQSWMDLALADADAKLRITRAVPVALDAAIVEMGPPQPVAADMKWMTKRFDAFETLESPIRELARTGYRVGLVRARQNDLDVLVVKPAGTPAGSADYDLDEGPWGGSCSRGALVGAAVQPDGDVACVADRSGAAVTNRGLDLTVRPQSSSGGHILFRGAECDIRARLTSTRPASPRVAFAAQFEREIANAIEPGFRVVRALAARDSGGQMRIVALTSDRLPDPVVGAAAPSGEGAPLVPDMDGVGEDLPRQREARLNASLARDTRFAGRPLWMELAGRGGRTAHLLGCVALPAERELAASVARGLLVGEGLGDYRIESRVIVDR